MEQRGCNISELFSREGTAHFTPYKTIMSSEVPLHFNIFMLIKAPLTFQKSQQPICYCKLQHFHKLLVTLKIIARKIFNLIQK